MQRVLILGATSKIAGEVARIYGHRGDRVHLVGRNLEKLAAVRRACGTSNISTQTADFCEAPDCELLVRNAIEALGGVDIVLIAHGDLGNQLESERSFAQAETTIRTNFLSVIALLIPLANHMEQARHGTLGVMTSVAGDRGRPRNYTYGAAKGALNVYLQGLRTRLYRSHVRVTTLKLGPVDTPMTRDHKKTLLFADASRVAQGVVRAVDIGIPEAYLPSFWGAIMPLVRFTPERLFQVLPFLSGR